MAGSVLRVNHLETRQSVKVQIDTVFGFVAVIVGYDDVNLLVAQLVDFGRVVLDGDVQGVVVFAGFVFPNPGRIFLAASVEVDHDACNGAEGVTGKNGERDVAFVAGP